MPSRASALDAIFEDLLKRGGSVLHLTSEQPPVARIRGDIVALGDGGPLKASELEEMLMGLVTSAQRERLAAELTIDFSLAHKDVARFRARYYVKQTGLSATFHSVPLSPPSLAEIGAPEVLWRLADRRSGLVLIAGPSSNGKTTTMGAMVDHINKTRACHIVTIEDPLELVHEPLRAQLTQREVGTHAPTLAKALENARRESPDVVVISDLVEAEEIEHALRLAADGVLVLACYRASGVVTAIERLVSTFGFDRYARMREELADCLAGIVVQHLVRAADSKTRLPAHEILIATPTVAALIRQGKMEDLKEAMTAGGLQGMQPLDDALERLVNAGRVAPEAALDRAVDRAEFTRVAGEPGPS